MKKIEIIIPHEGLTEAHNVLKDVNVGGISHYRIEGSGRVKADPVLVGTHPGQPRPEYVSRTKVEVVVKDDQVAGLVSNLRERLRSTLGGKIFVVDVPVAVDIASNKTGEDAI
jgi:nitrogen regulatory protein P-II 1